MLRVASPSVPINAETYLHEPNKAGSGVVHPSAVGGSTVPRHVEPSPWYKIPGTVLDTTLVETLKDVLNII